MALADLDEIRAQRRITPAAASPASPDGLERNSASSDKLRGFGARLRSRTTPPAGFCWHCRKPLHARADRCPFCGEAQ